MFIDASMIFFMAIKNIFTDSSYERTVIVFTSDIIAKSNNIASNFIF